MTRFSETLCVGVFAFAAWASLLWYASNVNRNAFVLFHIRLLPLYGLVLFGAISAAIVLYRVFTFNDCPNAYDELQRQIKQARHDLQQKGFTGVSNKKAN